MSKPIKYTQIQKVQTNKADKTIKMQTISLPNNLWDIIMKHINGNNLNRLDEECAPRAKLPLVATLCVGQQQAQLQRAFPQEGC